LVSVFKILKSIVYQWFLHLFTNSWERGIICRSKRMNIMEKLLGFLSVLLGLLAVWEAKRTDILVKTEDERAKSLIRELGEMTKETQKMIDEGNKRTQELMAETQKMIEKMDKRHQETMEYLGSLIKADGEKTRELINKVIEKIPG